MSENYNAVTDGTYVLQQGEDGKQFFFFRKDGGEINQEEADPMDLYQAFVCRQMFESPNPSMVMGNLKFETSTDNKCIRITVVDFSEIPMEETKPKKKKGWLERIKEKFHKKER
ncbi:MAG: hypothetical protein IKK84_02530 [Clostridia bacterium]|nr:hypothetical protein [Clostridia bacterium]